MNNDLISRSRLRMNFIQAVEDENPELYGEIILDIIDNAQPVEMPNYAMGYQDGVRKVLKEVAEGKHRPQGVWIDYSNEGYVECPFCGSATNCEDNKDELHYCWNCGAKMKGGAE